MNECDKLKVLLDIPESDCTKDEILSLLIEMAHSYFLSYCRRNFADESMTPLIIRMAAEDYGKIGAEGLSYRSVSGLSESVRGEYSPQIMAQLRRYRRIGGPEC